MTRDLKPLAYVLFFLAVFGGIFWLGRMTFG